MRVDLTAPNRRQRHVCVARHPLARWFQQPAGLPNAETPSLMGLEPDMCPHSSYCIENKRSMLFVSHLAKRMPLRATLAAIRSCLLRQQLAGKTMALMEEWFGPIRFRLGSETGFPHWCSKHPVRSAQSGIEHDCA